MHGCLAAVVTLFALAALDVGLWRLGAGQPTWLLPLAAALAAAGAVLATSAAWKGGRRWRALHRRGAWADGALVAVRGRLAAEGPLLTAPGSGRPCVLYEYTLRRLRREGAGTGDGSTRRERVAFNGQGMTPLAVVTDAGRVPLTGYPSVEPAEKQRLAPEALPRLLAHLAESEIGPPIAVSGALAAWRADFPEGVRELRRDRETASALDLDGLRPGQDAASRALAIARLLEEWKDERPFVTELSLADGEEVVAFGRWDASTRTLEVGGHGVDSARAVVPAVMAWGLEGYYKVSLATAIGCGVAALVLHALIARALLAAPPG
jgi:hypothetical protein